LKQNASLLIKDVEQISILNPRHKNLLAGYLVFVSSSAT